MERILFFVNEPTQQIDAWTYIRRLIVDTRRLKDIYDRRLIEV